MTIVAVASRRWTSLPGQTGTVVGALSDYVDALAAVGMAAVLVPFQAPPLALAVLHRCDGLLLTGGEDVGTGCESAGPQRSDWSTDEGRDEFELLLLNHARLRGVPILAICRGLHLLNIACGGTISHLSDAVSSPLRHVTKWQEGEVYVHDLSIVEGSLLASVWSEARVVRVNGSHRYCVRVVGNGLRVSATSPDGAVEAIEATDGGFCLGVQWHPECLVLRGDHNAIALFRAFAVACADTPCKQPDGGGTRPTGGET